LQKEIYENAQRNIIAIMKLYFVELTLTQRIL